MNKVILVGRISSEIELRYTSSNIPVASFSLAVNRPHTNAEGEREADFINIVVWRKPAENLKDYMSKGSRIGVEGSIQTRSYEDNNGNKRYVTEIVADNMQLLGKKSDNPAASQGGYQSYQQPAQPVQQVQQIQPKPAAPQIEEMPDDDLPF